MKLLLLGPFALGGLLLGGCIPLMIHAATHGDHSVSGDPKISVTTSDGDRITIESDEGGQTITGSGALKAESRSVGDFHGIDVGSIIRLRYTAGPATSVSVSAQPNILPHVITSVKDGTLELELKGSFRDIEPITVTVTSPHLDYLEASGASDASAEGLKEDRVEIHVSGSSKAKVDGDARVVKTYVSGSSVLTGSLSGKEGLSSEVSGDGRMVLTGPFGDASIDCSGASEAQIDKVEAGKLEVTSSGSSHVTIGGSSDSLTVTCEGDSDGDLSNLVAKSCHASASGASHILTNVSGELDAEASGASEVQYKGKPTVHQSESGVGHVQPLNP